MKSHLPALLRILFTLGLISGFSNPGVAQDAITPFEASYSLFVSGMHVANSELSLAQSGPFWRWRLSAKSRGLYAMLSPKKPYSETTFSIADGLYRIDNLLIDDGDGERKVETARFDWQKKQVEIQRKNRLSAEVLQNEIYDYLGINWLTALMSKHGIDSTQFNFYYKGRLIKSALKRIADTHLEFSGKEIKTRAYEQTSTQSKSSLRFYYAAENPLIPLKIEAFKSGEQTSVLLLQKFIQH